MSSVLIENVIVAGSRISDASGWVLAENGAIAAVGHGSPEQGAVRTLDGDGAVVMPGFVDVHNHGAIGIDVNEADADGLMKVAAFLAKNGVTAWLPTLVPDSDDNYRRVITEIDRLMELQRGEPVAQAVGVHYEGIFANAKMCGALRPEYFKTFTGTEIEVLPRLKSGVHMMTLAPEIEGGVQLVGELNRRGWIISIGHTRASVETLDDAFKAGGRHLTHFYNAMTGLHHRDVGVVGWAFTNEEVTFDIIADGIHVAPRPLEFACRTRSPDKVMLISDSVAPTGLGDGDFELWGERVKVTGGRTQNERGSIAGSVITMLDAVRLMRSIGFSDEEIALMTARNPSRLIGLDREIGSTEVGKRADLVALGEDGNVKIAVVGGEIVE